MSSSASASNVYSPVTDISFNNTTKNIKPILQPPSIPFWGDDPNVLLQNPSELFPVENMTYNQSLNAITRLVLLATIILFLIFPRKWSLIFISLVTLGSIWAMHQYHMDKLAPSKKKVRFDEDEDDVGGKENFEGGGKRKKKDPAIELLGEVNPDIFQTPSSNNPFSNTLMTDYDFNPHKKPAPPSFNINTNDEILNRAKQTVIDCNPGQPDIADKLFRDLGEQLVFEQSMRPFYSTASTTIPNDQTSFAEFCYGSMISCKEGNNFACARNLSRHTNI
jgi:hypothetical protein